MDSGEKELRKAFEEVTKRNVQASIDFGNETRKMVRELEIKIQNLENLIINKDGIIKELQKQVAFLQQKMYTGGTD